MIVFLILCVFLPTHSVKATSSSDQYKGLKFANDGYIIFSPDMSPFVNKISVCSWVRDLGSSSYPTLFSYGSGNRVRFQSDGDYNCVADYCGWLHLKNKLTVPKGTWFHACLTWSTSSRTLRYYADGQLLGVGPTQTPYGRALATGYKIVLGNHASQLDSNYAFGGEMIHLNAYAKELSAGEIKGLAYAGMCSVKDDENEDVRVLKWEDMLKKTRTGTVTEINLIDKCIPSEIMTRLEEAEQKVNETAEQLSETRQTLEEVLKEKEEIKQTLNQTQIQLNTTELELQDVSTNLNRTAEELQTALNQLEHCNKTSQRWDWDLFSLDTYVNKTISSEVSEQLRSSWDNIAEMMIGFTITDQFITFLKHIDTDECTDERPWSMLYTERYLNKVFTREMAESLSTMWDGISDKLVGVTMTEKTIELLNYIERIHHL